MGSLNKATLIGRLGKDPELRYTQTGTAVVTLSLATDESYTDKQGNKVKSTEWHRIVVWGKQAEIAHQYMRKGSQIYVEGKIKTRQWEDRQGAKKYTTEITCESFVFLESKKDQTGPGAQSSGGYGGPEEFSDSPELPGGDIGDDDIPF